MRYYKELSEKGYVNILGAGDDLSGIEITEQEYNLLMEETMNKGNYIERIYSNEITINDVPSEWQEEIQFRVDEMIESFGPYQLTNEEIDTIILGGVIE